jgi:hypothetical protein
MEKLSDNYRFILKEEIIFVTKKMRAGKSLDEKLFFFSAIYAMIQRIINLEYNGDLVFAFHVIQRTYEMFFQRLTALKSGDTSVLMSEAHFIALDEAMMAFLRVLEENGSLDVALKAFSIASYSTTGNGYYLMEKGMLKIDN